MSYAMELSPAGFNELLIDLDMLGLKIGRAFLRAQFYMRRFGSLPSGDRALASILGLTVRFLTEVAWPLLQDRLVLSEDGERYYDPEISAAKPRQGAEKPKADLSERGRKASNARWNRPRQQTEMLMQVGSSAHAKPHASSMLDDAKRMQQVSENPAISMPVASDLHEVASHSDARAHSLSPSDSSLNPVESDLQGETAREGVAREADATGMQTDATGHAKPPVKAPLPADWQPSAAVADQVRGMGLDPVTVAVAFCAHYTARATVMADWDAQFISWCIKEPAFQQQAGAKFLAGNAPQPKENYLVKQARELAARRAG
jgi:hypothetical protein